MSDFETRTSMFVRYTITLPVASAHDEGEAFDCWIHNMHEPTMRLHTLVERADADATGDYVDYVLPPVELSTEDEFAYAAAILRRLRETLGDSGEGNRLDDALDIFDEVHQQFGG